jgi:hypothetical protein
LVGRDFRGAAADGPGRFSAVERRAPAFVTFVAIMNLTFVIVRRSRDQSPGRT